MKHIISSMVMLAALAVAVPAAAGNWIYDNVQEIYSVRFVNPLPEAGSTTLSVAANTAGVQATISYDVSAEAKIRYVFTRAYHWEGMDSPTSLTVTVSGNISGSRNWGSASNGATSSLSFPALSDTIGLSQSYSGTGAEKITFSTNASVDTVALADATTPGQAGFTARADATWTP